MTRIAVASIVQETNTFSPRLTMLDDFRSQSLHEGEDAARLYRGTNTEFGGAIDLIEERGIDAVSLIHAWGMSSGRVTMEALRDLEVALQRRLEAAGHIDALVLSLHGAMAAVGSDDADAELLRTARRVVGPHVPIGVCLDLHANVTPELIAASNVLIGYRTYPHVDQAGTGRRIAGLLVDLLAGRCRPVTALAKRPMILPAEGQGEEGPFGELRSLADRLQTGDVLDISLFPVQPWLDVDGLGFAVTVTTDGDKGKALSLAEEVANDAWRMRHSFKVTLVEPIEVLESVRQSTNRPVLLSESADSPTAGATADSPAMVKVLLDAGGDLRAYVTLVDESAVGTCCEAGVNAAVRLRVGASLDPRFHAPVDLEGQVQSLGSGAYPLTGPVFHGMEVNMGRWAVVRAGRLSVLLTERPACTFDPETYRHVGLPPEEADVIVVRSAHLFRAGWADVAGDVYILDLPGASTPRLDSLTFTRAPRPLYPLEDV